MEEQNMMAAEEAVSLDGINLFDDMPIDETSDEQQQTEEPAEAAEETEAEQPAEEQPFLRVTYNGEDRDLTAEEAKTLAQKGLNYDRIKEKADQAEKWKKSADMIERFAEAAGVSVEEYLEQAAGQLDNRSLRSLTDKGMDEDTARELLSLRAEHAKAQQAKSAEAAQAKSRADFDELVNYMRETNNGEIPKDMEHLPQEMADAIDRGEKPLVAYLKMRAKQNAEKEAAINAANNRKQKSVGSAKGTASTSVEDGFLKALFG